MGIFAYTVMYIVYTVYIYIRINIYLYITHTHIQVCIHYIV